MILVGTVFFISLLGIVGLFALKIWEERHSRVLVPELRDLADEKAIRLKAQMIEMRAQIARLPPEAMHITRLLIHVLALRAAALARKAESAAHRLADMVSHKRGFERTDTKSQFLKKIRSYSMRQIRHGTANESAPSKPNEGSNGEKEPKTL